jgi:Kef-type K+ transport system membrane component KefB
MRWFASLFALLLMMALFHRLTAGGALEARATLALGFLLLAAQLGGDIARRARLPRITGYLLLGFAAGPAWLGLVRPDEVAALRFISDAAVALIAFAAGSELTLEALRADRTTITRLATGAIVAPFVVVAAVVFSVGLWFPITVHQPVGDRLAVALVLGTVAAASSPAVTMAVISELDARGPFARAILSVTIAKDVAVIALLALVLALARPLTSAGALNLMVAWTALTQLLGSVAVGTALGYALAAYLRRFQRDMPLFLVAVAFVAAEVAQLIHLETMLIALAAGFYLENFSRVEGERLRGALRRGSLPVYVVFFALAGAGLQVEALTDLWPWVLLVAGLRAVALRVGVRWAGRDPGVSPVLARQGWLGLISQAGVTLGLAAAARRAFPEWGISLETMIVAMIGVHELVGPICFRWALRLAGEIKEGEHVGEKTEPDRVVLAPGSGGV